MLTEKPWGNATLFVARQHIVFSCFHAYYYGGQQLVAVIEAVKSRGISGICPMVCLFPAGTSSFPDGGYELNSTARCASAQA